MNGEDPNRIINYRPLFLAAVGFMLGSALFGLYSAHGRSSILAAAAFAVIVLASAAAFAAALKRRSTFICILIAAALLGAARMSAAAPDTVKEGEYTLRGTVFEVSGGKKAAVSLCRAELNGAPLKYRVKLETTGGAPRIGQRIELSCKVRTPERQWGAYNERLALLSNGISLKASGGSYTVVSDNDLPVWRTICGVKQALHNRIMELFPENGTIVAGFLLGERTGMDEYDEECFKETGTAHLLTLSGFHVGLITALLFFLLPKRFPWLRFAAVTLFLLFYCSITAFAPSLVRASIMCVCIMIADVAERRADTLSSLSLAALIILAVSPYKIYSTGFRLSFAATFGIILFTRMGVRRSKSRAVSYLIELITVTFAATAATVLFTANTFGVLPAYTLLSNIVAVPLFSVAVTMSFAALLIGMPLPEIGFIAAWPADRIITGAMRVLGFIRSLPYSQIRVFRPSSLTAVLLLVLMFFVSPFVLRPLNKRIRAALPVFLLFTVSVFADIIRV